VPDTIPSQTNDAEAPVGDADAAVPSPGPAAVPAAVSAGHSLPAASPTPVFTAARQPAQLLYRLVEVVRDDRGRLREEGRVWHADLQQVRRFARAVAGSTAAHRVVVADGSGRIMEELSASVGHHEPTHWCGWKQIPVPPLPTRPAGSPARLRRGAAQLPVARPTAAALSTPAVPARPSAAQTPTPVSPPAAPAEAATAVAPAQPAAVPDEPSTQDVEVELP